MRIKILFIIGSILLVAGCYRPPYYQRLPYGYEYTSPYSYCGGSCTGYNCAKPATPVHSYKPPPPYIGGPCYNKCNYGRCSY